MTTIQGYEKPNMRKHT
jgi:hypothetical protein